MKTFTFVIAAAIAMTACGSDEQMMVTSTAAAAEATVEDITVDDLFALERGFITVPADRDDVNAGAIDLAYARAGRTLDLEPMLVHFGGPGSSVTERLIRFARRLPPEIMDRYTLIGLDDIGVGGSPRFDCFSGLEGLQFSAEFNHPFLEGTEEDFEGFGRSIADSCAASQLIDQAGTARYARDIDQLREAFGYERLNILGFSYGTGVALTYAALFPDNVARMVLDSPYDPRTNFVELILRQNLAYGLAFDRFIAWCDQQSDCSIGADQINALVDDLAVVVPDNPQATEAIIEAASEFLSLLSFAVLFETRWPDAVGPLQEAIEDPTTLVGPEAEDNPSNSSSGDSSALFATYGNDYGTVDPMEIVDAVANFKDMNQQSQLSSKVRTGFFDIAYPFAFWAGDPQPLPVDSRLPSQELTDSILVISATGDTRTPRSYTEDLVGALPGLSVVSVDEVSHSVSTSGLNPCLEGAMVEFFTEGTVSVSDCPKSASPEPDAMSATEAEALLAEWYSLVLGDDELIPRNVVPRR